MGSIRAGFGGAIGVLLALAFVFIVLPIVTCVSLAWLGSFAAQFGDEHEHFADAPTDSASSKSTEAWAVIDHGQVFVLHRDATEPIRPHGYEVVPRLIIHHGEGVQNVIIETKSVLPDQTEVTVTVRLDGESAREMLAAIDPGPLDAGGDAIELRDGKSLMREMLDAGRISVQFTPKDATPQTANFSLQGLDQHIDDLD